MSTVTAARQQAENMVLGQLYTNYVRDPRILKALLEVPREPFLPEKLRGAAYVDEDLETSPGRGLMAPLTFARLIQLADIRPESRLLVIGCLNGYPAAVLAKLALQVVATELDIALVDQAREHMRRLSITNVDCRQVASLSLGHKAGAPYDVIFIYGAVQEIPEALTDQLAIGGRLVAVRNELVRPGTRDGLGKGLLVKRFADDVQYREHFDASGLLLPGLERMQTFSF